MYIYFIFRGFFFFSLKISLCTTYLMGKNYTCRRAYPNKYYFKIGAELLTKLLRLQYALKTLAYILMVQRQIYKECNIDFFQAK